MTKKKLLVVAGPTAVGKTRIAIALARSLSTAVVSADSRQVFRELNIGTAKPSPAERAIVPHHLISTRSITETYDAAQYADEALQAINDIFSRSDHVILCGGSGLYIKAVCEGFDEIPEVPPHLREEINAQYQTNGVGWLQYKLKENDPAVFEVIDRHNPHRMIRALEVKLSSGKSILDFQKRTAQPRDFQAIKIGLELPREELYEKIDARMDAMIAEGLFKEAENLYPYRHHQALQTVGYQEIFGWMEKQYDYDECVRLLKRNSRRYAKRQLTWFKKDPGFQWFHPDDFQKILSLS